MKFKSAFGDGVFLHSLTPKEPLLHIMRHEIYVAKTMPTFVAKFLLYAEAIQVCKVLKYVSEVTTSKEIFFFSTGSICDLGHILA